MGYRNVSFLAEEENGVSTSVSDTLLFATMCIIGLPVDVHAKDGSIYSGIFHTACLEDAYAVVLKKARVVKKGNRETNVADGKLIDTLIVLSEDLVQVVAKELLLPAEGISGKVGTEDVGAMADIIPQDVCEEREVDATNPKEPNMDDKHINGTRFLDPIQNCFPNGSVQNNFLEVARGKSDGQNFVKVKFLTEEWVSSGKKAEASTVSSNGRQVGDSSEEKQGGFREDPILQTEQTTDEVEGSRSSLDACRSKSSATENMNAGTNKEERANCVPFERCTVAKFDDPSHERHTVEENQQSVALSSSVSADATSVVHVASDFGLSSSSASSKAVLPQNANYSRPAKVSKLNPRARLFSPSPVLHRSATPPAVPSPPSMTHTPEPSPVVSIATPEPEVDMSSFAYRSSVPAKFPPQNNLFLGNGRSELHYVQPIIGHVGSRTPPVRFAGQYNHLQAAHGYVHPNMENVMAGRVGPLVYVHPTSNDVTQATAGYSQPSLRPLLTQHQVNLLKHQGTATMQALQLYATPPFMANGQQPFPTQSFIPISPPLFPVVASIPVPGSDGSLGTKFA